MDAAQVSDSWSESTEALELLRMSAEGLQRKIYPNLKVWQRKEN